MAQRREAWEMGSWIRCCEGGGLINVFIMFGTCLFEDPGVLCVDILRRLPWGTLYTEPAAFALKDLLLQPTFRAIKVSGFLVKSESESETLRREIYLTELQYVSQWIRIVIVKWRLQPAERTLLMTWTQLLTCTCRLGYIRWSITSL